MAERRYNRGGVLPPGKRLVVFSPDPRPAGAAGNTLVVWADECAHRPGKLGCIRDDPAHLPYCHGRTNG